MNKPILSIVILSYNTYVPLKDCLTSLEKVRGEVAFEVIVSDNGSSDGSTEMVRKDFSWVKVIKSEENLGFAKGNNRVKDVVEGEYVLFLNSDTIVPKNTLKETVSYLDAHPQVGALTSKIILPSGRLDKDARRSFPTPWVSLTHFSHLDRLFSKSRIFAKYWYGYIPENTIHEVDVLQGAFFLARKKILDEVGWFDEDYFLDGEDIDLSWKIKEKGWKIIYYPKVFIRHIKGAAKKLPSLHDRLRFVMSGVDSMEIFYKKRLWLRYPVFVNIAVLLGINILRVFRYIKLILQ